MFGGVLYLSFLHLGVAALWKLVVVGSPVVDSELGAW